MFVIVYYYVIGDEDINIKVLQTIRHEHIKVKV